MAIENVEAKLRAAAQLRIEIVDGRGHLHPAALERRPEPIVQLDNLAAFIHAALGPYSGKTWGLPLSVCCSWDVFLFDIGA